jgi:uncharacterized protein YndB with AHSA1/START domain
MPAPASASGKAVTVKKLFSRQTSVSATIQAAPAIIWALLTNASDFPRWNSTVISIEGEIRPGAQIRLKSTLDPKRVFTLKIKTFEPEKQLIWGDPMGARVYTLSPAGNGAVTFSMTEKIGGPLFPLFSGMIPSFDQSFEQYAADLKKEAELIQNAKA